MENHFADDDICQVDVYTFFVDGSADKGDEKSWSLKCICRGLSSPRALIFHRTPIYGADTLLVRGATTFLTLFIATLSSDVEVT